MAEPKKSTKTETKTAPKPEAKSDSKPAESNSADASGASSESSSGGEGGKSARDSVGGAAVGHYGYFSNIKTPEYKSGWDDIWGNDKSAGKKKASAKKKAAPKRKEPRVVAFDFEDLPAELQAGLADAARAQLKKARINYATRDKAGAVTWRIECKVER
jgi:hypothetical protein